jgi:hypothetical protein
MGALMGIRRTLLDAGLTLSLTGLKLKHRFLLHAWCAHPLFDECESTIDYGRSKAKELDATGLADLHGKQEPLPAQTRARG